MSYEIRFRVNNHLRDQVKDKDAWDRDVVERVEQIVEGSGHVHEKDSGYRWTLGTTNNWWMDRDQQTCEFILAYRYANPSNYHHLEAIRQTIIFVLALQPFNEKEKIKAVG